MHDVSTREIDSQSVRPTRRPAETVPGAAGSKSTSADRVRVQVLESAVPRSRSPRGTSSTLATATNEPTRFHRP